MLMFGILAYAGIHLLLSVQGLLSMPACASMPKAAVFLSDFHFSNMTNEFTMLKKLLLLYLVNPLPRRLMVHAHQHFAQNTHAQQLHAQNN